MKHEFVFLFLYVLLILSVPGVMIMLAAWMRLHILGMGWKAHLFLLGIFAVIVIWPMHAPASAITNAAADGLDVADLQQQVRAQDRDWEFMGQLIFRDQFQRLFESQGAGCVNADIDCAKALEQAELQYGYEWYRPYENSSIDQLPPQLSQLMLGQ